MLKLFVVRHAEPELSGTLLGQSDPPLTPRGREQAQRCLVPGRMPIYSSPLRRAHQSALLLARDAPVILVPGLREITYGAWDGLTWAAIERSRPEVATLGLASDLSAWAPGGEPWRDFHDRVNRSLDTIRGPAIIVAHSAVNAVIVQRYTGRDPAGFRQAYCEVIELDAP